MTRAPAATVLTVALVLAGLLPATSATAHDLWIEPADWTPRVGQATAVELRVGAAFPGETVARRSARIERFSALGADGESALPGVEGASPAGVARWLEAGEGVLVYRSSESALTLDAAPFEAYLEEEGLEHVSRLRAARGESEAPGREVFSRSVKALVTVRPGGPTDAGARSAHPRSAETGFAEAGSSQFRTTQSRTTQSQTAQSRNAGSGAHVRPAGLALELVPETSPADLAPGDELSVRLLWRGEPLVGALVRSEHGAAGLGQRVRTDEAGRVTVRLDAAGPWKLAAVHMAEVPQPAAAGGADWRSVWTSLVFCLAPPGASRCEAGMP